MGKKDLVKAVAASTGATQADVGTILNGILDAICEGLKEDGKVVLTGFGTFEMKELAERRGFNIHTREEIVIPARRSAKFKAGKTLKDIS